MSQDFSQDFAAVRQLIEIVRADAAAIDRLLHAAGDHEGPILEQRAHRLRRVAAVAEREILDSEVERNAAMWQRRA